MAEIVFSSNYFLASFSLKFITKLEKIESYVKRTATTKQSISLLLDNHLEDNILFLNSYEGYQVNTILICCAEYIFYLIRQI